MVFVLFHSRFFVLSQWMRCQHRHSQAKLPLSRVPLEDWARTWPSTSQSTARKCVQTHSNATRNSNFDSPLPQVVIVHSSPSSAAAAEIVASDISSLPNASTSGATTVCADLSSPSAPSTIVSATLSAFGPHIDILVNNAAVQVTRPLSEITPDDYGTTYDLNVRAVVFLTQAVLPHLRGPGRIINVSSVGARSAFASLSLYCSSKAALEGLTRAWAAELGGDGTTVNAVAPGPVESDMLESVPQRIVEMQKENTPVGKRLGLPGEVSSVVSWLASRESSWISGQTLSVSGGWTVL